MSMPKEVDQRFGDLLISSIVSSDACIVEVETVLDGQVVRVSGTAKRHPTDKPNTRVAQLLAFGRAMNSLGHRAEKMGNGLVKHNDDIKVMRPLQQKRSVEHKKRQRTRVNSDNPRIQIAAVDQARTREGAWSDKSSRATASR